MEKLTKAQAKEIKQYYQKLYAENIKPIKLPDDWHLCDLNNNTFIHGC